MNTPLVTVICLCYNYKQFVREAVESVLRQTYPSIQLIVVDDASTDGSAQVINQLKEEYPVIELVLLKENIGNCKAFNKAWRLSKGEFVIDLSADDVLMPGRISEGVKALQLAGAPYGVHFCDADYINAEGIHLNYHSDKYPHRTIPQGDVYEALIRRYFICPPSVMFTRRLLDEMNGYDESLSYEDFDIYIRSSRKFNYIYSPSVLVKKRVTTNALSEEQFKVFNKHSNSTYKVCEKIMLLNKSKPEQQALNKRIVYEIKLNLRLLNFIIALRYFLLWVKNSGRVYGK